MSSWFYLEQTFSTSQGWFSFFIRTVHRSLGAKFENHSKTICQSNLNFIEKKYSCDYGNSKLTLDEVIVTGSACSGLKCSLKSDLSGTLLRPVGSCAPSTTRMTTARTTTRRTTRAKPTRTTRAKTTRTTKPRTTKPRTRTTKPPRTKKPRRIPNRFKRVCVYNGRTINVDLKLHSDFRIFRCFLGLLLFYAYAWIKFEIQQSSISIDRSENLRIRKDLYQITNTP